MIYYARSQNSEGKQETIMHHLSRTAELCAVFTEEFEGPEVGRWMGMYHDFGKYGRRFQEVLQGKMHNIDHALPGAAFLKAQLCGKAGRKSPYWPMVASVRAHHSYLRYDCDDEIENWGKGESTSFEGKLYSLKAEETAEAIRQFRMENMLMDKKIPCLEKRDKSPPLINNNGKMLYTRMLFSALTDADYSASAEHFDKNYLQKSAVPPFDPLLTWKILEEYRNEIIKNSRADPAVNTLRNQLFAICRQAGREYPSGVYTLTAPTGAGKTLAMLAFGLQQMLYQNKRRIILVLPYLSIIEQNAEVYRHILPDILEDHSQAERNGDTIAAKELSQRWDAPFIITTSVKFFESLFACTGPACRKLHHLANSVILFDEAQSLPARLAGATLTSMCELAKRFHAAVVFSTATQPDFAKLPEVEWKPKEIVPDGQAMFAQARRVSTDWRIDKPAMLEEIAEEAAKEKNACLIVNLRGHAKKVYEKLVQLRGEKETFLLTTDLCPAHRTQILNEVRALLREGKPCFLAATQCIEAGVDISFTTVYRALAPLESIIQAAGRCNRNDTRRRGKFVVFVPEENNLSPDKFYTQSANAVKTLASRHNIDLNSLADIQEYYAILFGSGEVHDKRQLTDAIQTMDFQAVSRHYRLIESDQMQIVVPYTQEPELFQALAKEARHNGISATWMRKAAPVTVQSYERDMIKDICEPLYMYKGRERLKEETGWYLLSNNMYYDSQRKGLQLSDTFDGIF